MSPVGLLLRHRRQACLFGSLSNARHFIRLHSFLYPSIVTASTAAKPRHCRCDIAMPLEFHHNLLRAPALYRGAAADCQLQEEKNIHMASGGLSRPAGLRIHRRAPSDACMMVHATGVRFNLEPQVWNQNGRTPAATIPTGALLAKLRDHELA